MVTPIEDAARWQAPGPLEDLRRFLNTWDFSPASGSVTERLPALAARRQSWCDRFSRLPFPRRSDVAQLMELRDDLRAVVERRREIELINVMLQRWPLESRVATDDRGAPRVVQQVPATTSGHVLAIVLGAIESGDWMRLKSCPGCRLVFFDRTRNQTKRWCQMTAPAGGRACGSIAKVTSWRARQRERVT